MSVFFDGVPNPDEKAVVTIDTLSQDSLQSRRQQLGRTEEEKFVFHPPFQERLCEECHDLGAGNQLTEQPPALCYNCHDDLSENYAYLHGPVASGNCTGCHNPHMAAEAKLLSRTGQDLCLFCHQRSDILKNEAHEDLGETDCAECHNPHGGEDRYIFNE